MTDCNNSSKCVGVIFVPIFVVVIILLCILWCCCHRRSRRHRDVEAVAVPPRNVFPQPGSPLPPYGGPQSNRFQYSQPYWGPQTGRQWLSPLPGKPSTGRPPPGRPPPGQPPTGQPPQGQPPPGQPPPNPTPPNPTPPGLNPPGQPPTGQPLTGQPPPGLTQPEPPQPGQPTKDQAPKGQATKEQLPPELPLGPVVTLANGMRPSDGRVRSPSTVAKEEQTSGRKSSNAAQQNQGADDKSPPVPVSDHSKRGSRSKGSRRGTNKAVVDKARPPSESRAHGSDQSRSRKGSVSALNGRSPNAQSVIPGNTSPSADKSKPMREDSRATEPGNNGSDVPRKSSHQSNDAVQPSQLPSRARSRRSSQHGSRSSRRADSTSDKRTPAAAASDRAEVATSIQSPRAADATRPSIAGSNGSRRKSRSQAPDRNVDIVSSVRSPPQSHHRRAS